MFSGQLLRAYVGLTTLVVTLLSTNTNIGMSTGKYVKSIDHVIAIAIDGVREEDAEIPFKTAFKSLVHRGYKYYWYGKSHGCAVGQPYNSSLPAYANFFMGSVDPRVKNNEFKGKLNKKTLFDLYPKSQLFAAWEPLRNVMSDSLAVKESAVISAYSRFPRSGDDPVVVQLYREQYLKPKFAFVHFMDADNYAHNRNYVKYRKSVYAEAYHTMEIIDHTESLIPESGKLFIIFTDHSRGKFLNWHSHGPKIEGSRDIWVLLISSVPLPYTMAFCDHTMLHSIVKSSIIP